MAEDDPGRQAAANYAEGAVEGTIRCAEDLLGKAQRLAPVEEGTLRGSGTVVVIVNGSRFEGGGGKGAAVAAARAAALAGRPVTIEAEVAFNQVYAARQHEETGWQHPKGGEAKYLERPFRDNADRYGSIIGRAALARLNQGS